MMWTLGGELRAPFTDAGRVVEVGWYEVCEFIATGAGRGGARGGGVHAL